MHKLLIRAGTVAQPIKPPPAMPSSHMSAPFPIQLPRNAGAPAPKCEIWERLPPPA